MGAPLLLRFERLSLTSRLSLKGADPALSVGLALTDLEAGIGAGPIASLLGGLGTAQADVSLNVDTVNGLTVGGGTRVVVPARPKVGPIDVRVDYRIYNLRGSARHKTPQRFYGGVNFRF